MSEHVPVLLERCLALLAPAVSEPGRGRRRRDARAGWAQRGAARAAPAAAAGRPRPRHRGAVAARSNGWRRTPTARRSCTPSTTRSPTCSPGSAWATSRACSSTSASPRCSSTTRPAASPTPTTRRSTCAWTPRSGITAAEVLNTYPADELARVLSEYGEERFARRIADRVVRARAEEPFTSTARLADLVRDAIPAATRRTGGNPSKRTFQALRIEVNGELAALQRAMPAALAALAVARPDRRHVVPVPRGPARQAGARCTRRRRARPSTCRWCPRSCSPGCGCSPAAPRPRRPRRSRPTRGPRRRGCAPPSGSGRRHEHRRHCAVRAPAGPCADDARVAAARPAAAATAEARRLRAAARRSCSSVGCSPCSP